jgi:hypothetical protein
MSQLKLPIMKDSELTQMMGELGSMKVAYRSATTQLETR